MSNKGVSFHLGKYFSLRYIANSIGDKNIDMAQDINDLAMSHLESALSSDVSTPDDIKALLSFARHWKPRRFSGGGLFARALRLALTGKPD